MGSLWTYEIKRKISINQRAKNVYVSAITKRAHDDFPQSFYQASRRKGIGVESDLLSWSRIQLKKLEIWFVCQMYAMLRFHFRQLPFEFVQ